MLIHLFLWTYIAFCSIMLYVLLCGKMECHKGGIIEGIYDGFASILLKCCNGLTCGLLSTLQEKEPQKQSWFATKMRRLQSWVCEERNPLLQLVYLFLLHFNAAYYFYSVYFRMNWGETMSRFHQIALLALYIASQISFLLACYSNPGIITAESAEKFEIVHKRNLAYADAPCATCGFRKPARSKHCTYMKACVSKFDHYCPWINNAVGEWNYRYFHAFLITNWVLFFYGTITIIYYLKQVIVTNRLLEARFRDVNGKIISGSYALVFQYLMTQHIWSFAQIFFGVAMGIMLFLFWAYHFYSLALQNTTTAEAFKFEELDEDYDLLNDNINYFDASIPKYEKTAKYRHLAIKYKTLKTYVETKQPKPNLYGFYSKGWKQNLIDIIYPPSLYQKKSKFE